MARTESRVGTLESALKRLAQAQAKTEERMGGLESALERLAEAQLRTEVRIGGLESAVERLADAQKRTETRVEELAEAQRRTDERLGELADAQKRTELAVQDLAQAQAGTEKALQSLARQVGGLSETVGGDIEDIGAIVVQEVLTRQLGWNVSNLERTRQKWDGAEVEVDILGEARDPSGKLIWIIGEAKHNLTMNEVERFAQLVRRAREHLPGELFPVCFCYRASLGVQDRIKQLGLRLVFSYGKLV